MMATTMTPPTAAPLEPAKKSASGEVRFVSIRAHLLPGEVISGRQADVVRKQVVAALIVVVVLLIGWYGYSKWQIHSVNNDLNAAQSHGITLQNEQNQFGPLVQAQGDTAKVNTQLQRLMVGDLPWKTMLDTLRAKATNGVALTGITGSVDAGTSVNSGADTSSVLNTSGSSAIGQLTLTGTAPDKRSVAAYADALTTVRGVSAPLVSSVSATTGTLSFEITAVITSDALSGRYAAAPSATSASTGGK